MGKVKQLWQDEIEKVHEDFTNKKITFNEAYTMLCRLGYEPDHAIDSLDTCKQIELFPDSEQATLGDDDEKPKYDSRFKFG